MKKLLAVILSLIMIVGVFAGCSAKDDSDKPTDKQVEQSTEPTTADAVIKDADAIEYIKGYSAKELGLTEKQMKNCSFMVGGSGIEIKGDYYIKVIAADKKKHVDENGKETFTIDPKGEYYISYDGKKVLKKEMKETKETYTELEAKEFKAKSK